jgi:N-acetylneuraminate synthase
MDKTFIIAEIGINHNGDINITKELINGAVDAGCDAVKFQKRTVEEVYSSEELDKYRESPWGTTNREQKMGIEFGSEEYDEIDKYCKARGIEWFASAWDVESQHFLRNYGCKCNKVASAMLTNKELLNAIAEEGKYTFISTGMSTLEQIGKALDIFEHHECPFELMHCCSTYPMEASDANLNVMSELQDIFNCNVGYSGHETGIAVSIAAVAMGATSLERHITLDRSMYGSDQSASLEITGLNRLIKYVRTVEEARGDGRKTVTETEKEIAKKLRKVDTL